MKFNYITRFLAVVLFSCLYSAYSIGQVNAIHSFNGILSTGGWVKVGTLGMIQHGETVSIKFYGGVGYNASNSQNTYAEMFIRSSNSGTVDANGFAFSAFATKFGFNTLFIQQIRVVPNAAGVAATAFDIYIHSGNYIGRAFYHVTAGPNATWTNVMTVTTPGTGYDVPMQFRTLSDSYLGDQALYVSASTGNVGIGTLTPGARLAVNGEILSKKVRVTQSGWADHVFEPGYELPSLQAVESFIKANKHLPDIPSAKEVADKGVDLGENQAKLLQKVEELTLYLIELNKRLEAQQKIIDAQQQLLNKQ